MVSVHIHPAVKAAQDLYGGIGEGDRIVAVADILKAKAGRLHEAHRAGDDLVIAEINNWLPGLVGASRHAVLAADITTEDALLVVARSHGFESWQEVIEHKQDSIDPVFERAVDAAVEGRIAELTAILADRADLVSQRSAFGHRATLLHYLAANGVETQRQKVPSNVSEIAALLIAKGADVNALADVYGGRYDTITLLSSSTHPADAGVADALARVLRT